MNYKTIVIGVSIFVSMVACAGYYFYDYFQEHQKFATQIILTIIDDTEPSMYRKEIDSKGLLKRGTMGACTTKLLAALLEEQCIVIVSSSVVKHLMNYLETFDLKGNPFNLVPSKKIEPGNWIKKRVSDYLYVLIPKNYIHRRRNYRELKKLDIKKQENAPTLDELTIGMPFTSWADFNDDVFMDAAHHKGVEDYPEQLVERRLLQAGEDTFGCYERNLSWLSDHFIQKLPDMFIPRTYYKDFSEYMPQSIVIAGGHGSNYCSLDQMIQDLQGYGDQFKKEQESLCALKAKGRRVYYGGALSGLTSEDFGSFLDFLEKNLVVKLFVFSTCYGAEINTQEALGHGEEEKRVSFPLIAGALSNAPSTSGTLKRESWDKRNARDIRISLRKPLYKNFFDELNKYEDPSHENFLIALEHIYSFSEKSSESYNNIPSIKHPNKPWKVFEKSRILLIDNTVVQENILPTHQLDISRLFNAKRKHFKLDFTFDHHVKKEEDPYIVLLALDEIPCELIFSNNTSYDVPAFISVIPGDVRHHFTKINAPHFILSSLLKAFFMIPDLQEHKTFTIDELIIQNDTSVLPKTYEVLVLKNVVIINRPNMNGDDDYSFKTVSFEYDNDQWQVIVEKGVPISKSIKKVGI